MEIVYDVLIVGAGPCALALAARLREPTPSALFTDAEHERYHWIRRNARRTSIKNTRNGHVRRGQGRQAEADVSMLVLDSTAAEWMGKWNALFKTFRIEHLRSPAFFHVDPGERDALLGHAYENGQEGELREIKGVVGKEVSKHKVKKRAQERRRVQCRTCEPLIDERERKDYYTPSTRLFAGHCRDVVTRYGLQDVQIRKETVLDIHYYEMDVENQFCKAFNVRTETTRYLARTVVLAVGAANKPSIPNCIGDASQRGMCHAMCMPHVLHGSLGSKVRSKKMTHVLVVGGGLTSAQIADLVIREGVSKVWLIMRGPLKVKHFDLDLSWLGKFKNQKQAEFWTASSHRERLEMIKEARQGGSITPTYKRILNDHIRAGRLTICCHTTALPKTWDDLNEQWVVEFDPALPDLPRFDFIYYATGIATDVNQVEMLRTMRARYPIPCAGGLPCLNDDLMWCDEIPLFFTGRLASLQIGPGAANLSGARLGAERVAWGIESVLKGKGSNKQDEVYDAMDSYDMYSTMNRFDRLSTDEED